MSAGPAAAGAAPAGARAVAVFDLDGTLTWHDTLLPYLGFALRRRPARLARLPLAVVAVVRFAADRDRGRLKGALIRAVLGGAARAEVAALSGEFLDRRWARLFRPEALAALAAHRARGDYLVLLSASTDNYVPEIGRRLGVDEVISSELAWDGDRLDGRLASANRRGAEKTRCLASLRARHPGAPFAAYGNATSDLEHLATVEAPLVVNASRATRRRARAARLPCAHWR